MQDKKESLQHLHPNFKSNSIYYSIQTCTRLIESVWANPRFYLLPWSFIADSWGKCAKQRNKETIFTSLYDQVQDSLQHYKYCWHMYVVCMTGVVGAFLRSHLDQSKWVMIGLHWSDLYQGPFKTTSQLCFNFYLFVSKNL